MNTDLSSPYLSPGDHLAPDLNNDPCEDCDGCQHCVEDWDTSEEDTPSCQ